VLALQRLEKEGRRQKRKVRELTSRRKINIWPLQTLICTMETEMAGFKES